MKKDDAVLRGSKRLLVLRDILTHAERIVIAQILLDEYLEMGMLPPERFEYGIAKRDWEPTDE